MIDVRHAIETVLADLPLMDDEPVALRQTRGRTLAADLQATRDIPPFRNSAMDGYAVRATDVAGADQSAVELRVLEVIGAGDAPTRELVAGTASMVMTGAIVPNGADAVVRIEDSDGGREVVRIAKSVPTGHNVRLPGEDMKRGETVLSQGQTLRAADVGVLASLGITQIAVRRRPVVAILATGNELVEPDQPIQPGQIVNSNAYTLAAAVDEAGAVPRIMEIVRDDPEETRAAFEQAFDADVVLSTGGVSMGAFDLVRSTLAELGVRELFWKVAQKPGKPISFGIRNGRPIFGLPGNPVSSLVCFYLYVVPALRAMQGLQALHLATAEATATGEIKASSGLTDFIRCTLEGPLHALRARVTGTQSSGALRSMSLGDALLISPPNEARILTGQHCRVILIGDRYTRELPV